MSTEAIAEVVTEEPVDPERVEMQARIRYQTKLGSAVRDYMEALEKLHKARKNYDESYLAVSEIIEPSTTIVVSGGYGKHYGKHFLLTSDDHGDFEAELVEVI